MLSVRCDLMNTYSTNLQCERRKRPTIHAELSDLIQVQRDLYEEFKGADTNKSVHFVNSKKSID
jgi:hypothetical protein